MKKGKRIPLSNGERLEQNPFASLNLEGLPPGPESSPETEPPSQNRRNKSSRNRGRIDVIRQTAHRGGKTVTVITGFKGIAPSEIEQLAKQMQKTCGTGGTVKDGNIEIQGDRRQEVVRILTEAGFRPVLAGG